MQIADYLGQYANTLANAPSSAPAANAPGTAAVQNLVSSLVQMQEGTVFEGSINSIDGSKILLGLGNGQTISARLDGNVHLVRGQSVFFQVKSNDGNTISIKPYTGGQAINPTIQKALAAAGMEMTKETMDMVNRMMEEGMPIDKQSLAAMRQTLMQNPYISMQTAVTMARLGIPVNDQMAAQFENYQSDRYAMLDQMNQVMESLPDVYARASGGTADLLQLNQQIISILNPEEGAVQMQEQEPSPVFLENTQFVQEESADLQEPAAQETAKPQQPQPETGGRQPVVQSAAQHGQQEADSILKPEEMQQTKAELLKEERADSGPRQLDRKSVV